MIAIHHRVRRAESAAHLVPWLLGVSAPQSADQFTIPTALTCPAAQTSAWELDDSWRHETCGLEMIRARHLLIFLMLAGASVRSLSCDAQLEPKSVVSPASAVYQEICANPKDTIPSEDTIPSLVPCVLRSVSAVIDPRGSSPRVSNTIPLGLRN